MRSPAGSAGAPFLATYGDGVADIDLGALARQRTPRPAPSRR